MNLFESVPPDYGGFGQGDAFDAKSVSTLLGLKKEDVSRVASVSLKSVRYDDDIPVAVRERLQEIADTINMVAHVFDGDLAKTTNWFLTRNPMLGDVSPKEMIRLGRYERLRKFVIQAISERAADRRMSAGMTAAAH